MPPATVNKINASGTYPCPCRRQGHLSPIVLTDALGCEQCHHIFVVKPNGYTIEQCSAHYPPKTWDWTGRGWRPSRHKNRRLSGHLLLLTLCFGLIVVICFPTVLPFALSMKLRVSIVLIMAVLVCILWSSLYRP